MKKNRLAHETSPYLLQHQRNPVDWYPWGQEALERAQKEDKPILLSVGYSACHWCHVMAHECFENPEIARLMNEFFINIKVDREERPDLDHIYQSAAQMMTRSGGWPLTVFLTPELKPFFAGTYFPPEDRYGRPGFPRLLMGLSQAYRNDRENIDQNVQQFMELMSKMQSDFSISSDPVQEGLSFRGVAEQILQDVDWEQGGLQGAPKFPHAMTFSFLWRVGVLADIPKMRDAVYLTLRKMASGGIFDQLAGGFHRYSVDERWAVPHFEKMLYDNALLLKLYSEVLLSDVGDLQKEDRELFLNTLEKTVQYVLREMLSQEGLFFSAQDADSEGEEGKFFVWDLEDLSRFLSVNEAKAFAFRYGVTQDGNFDQNKTVLYLAESVSSVSEKMGKPAQELIHSASRKLFEIRSKRIAPLLDYKSLASWNGLMISGLIWASEALRNFGQKQLGEEAQTAAVKAFGVALQSFKQTQEGRLFSTLQLGQAKGNAFLDDYSFLAMAALDLSRFTDDAKKLNEYIRKAEIFTDTILKYFSAPDLAGYYFTSDDHEKLIQRPKTLFDQAIPSGTAVALQVICVLSEILESEKASQYRQELERQILGLQRQAGRNPTGMSELLNALLLWKLAPTLVSGAGAADLCRHFAAYQKQELSPSEGITLCHKGTCQHFPSANKSERVSYFKTCLNM